MAILVDSRTNQVSDLNSAVAITAIATIEEVAAEDKDYLLKTYLTEHPELKDFLYKPLSALMKVTVNDYIISTLEGVKYMPISQSK